MRRLVAATHLVLLVQARGYFPHAFGLYVVMVVGALLLLFSAEVARLVLPAFLVTEPGMLGVMAVAAHRYLELGSGSVSALHVSPLRPGEYLVALVLGSAVLATLGGAVTFVAVLGLDARLAWLIPVIFLFAVLSGLLGFALSLRYRDFPRFILGMIPAVLLWQAPLLAVYDVVPTGLVAWIPSAPGILALASVCGGGGAPAAMMGWVVAGVGLTAVGVVVVQRIYQRHLHSGWELA
jgi:fluoroquinolone transport system permease protein